MKSLALFIHGLGGNATSWGSFDRLIKEDGDLKDVVDTAFFVYPTSLWNRVFGRPLKLEVVVNALETEIDVRYRDYENILVIAHSMGGLIARNYIVDCIRNGAQLRVKHLLCFATPHNGAELASVLAYLRYSHSSIRALAIGSDFLSALNASWSSLKCAARLSITSVRGGRDAVVSPDSAAGSRLDGVLRTIAEKDHTTIIKPMSANDVSFLIVRQALHSIAAGGGSPELSKVLDAIIQRDQNLACSLVTRFGRSWIESPDSSAARRVLERVLTTFERDQEVVVWAQYLLAIERLFRINEASQTAFDDELVQVAARYKLDTLLIAERMEFARKADDLEPSLILMRQVMQGLLPVGQYGVGVGYAQGTSRFLIANLFRRGGRYKEAKAQIEEAQLFYTPLSASHQIELAHCQYAEIICRAMLGEQLVSESSTLIDPKMRLFSDALLTVTESHRCWLQGDPGLAISKADNAATLFDALNFGQYAKRARTLTELLTVWQKLNLGAAPDIVDEISPENASLLRGLLGVREAEGVIRTVLPRLRPSKALGLLQFATFHNDRKDQDVGEFALPPVLVQKDGDWEWARETVRTLEQADLRLRTLMQVPPNSAIPLLAD